MKKCAALPTRPWNDFWSLPPERFRCRIPEAYVNQLHHQWYYVYGGIAARLGGAHCDKWGECQLDMGSVFEKKYTSWIAHTEAIDFSYNRWDKRGDGID